MKITSRSLILWNIIIFSALSVGLFHTSGSDLINASAFSSQFFYGAKQVYTLVLSLVGVTILSIYIVSRVSKGLFLVMVLFVASLTVYQLTNNFSKLILMMLFLYLIVAYYYYQFLNLEIKQACYKPNFNKKTLFEPMLFKIESEIKLSEEQVLTGFLTNWDEYGCFVKLREPTKLPKEFNICIKLGSEVFKDRAKVVAYLGNGTGYGLKFKNKTVSRQSWINFINYTNDLGLIPEIVQ